MVRSEQKVSDTAGGFGGGLDGTDYFGSSVASIGDLNGDGVRDMAVGAPMDDDGGQDRGAVWILFLNTNGTVQSQQKISATDGGFAGMLDDQDLFGSSVALLGDLDGDGLGDLAVGAPDDDDGGSNKGAVWIILLNSNGTVKSHDKISATPGGFQGTLSDGDLFGSSVASIGPRELAVGAPQDDDGGANKGAVWILFLNPNGTVNTYQK